MTASAVIRSAARDRHTFLVILPTLNAARHFQRLQQGLAPYRDRVAIVDSDSTDGTPALFARQGYRVVQIDRRDFNHGGTRQRMVEEHPGPEVYIFITQDAYLEEGSLETLLSAFDDPDVGAAFGRQLPHEDANPLARHARLFNYPPESHRRTLADAAQYGVKTAFISNSFAAYRARALQEAGGFPANVILSEDMHLTTRMLLKGWQLAYVAEARCRHSHNYSLLEEFRRYFDIGSFHHRESWIEARLGRAEAEGWRFVKSELRYLGARHPLWLFRGLLSHCAKYAGYRLGRSESALPRGLKKRFSLHPGFWS